MAEACLDPIKVEFLKLYLGLAEKKEKVKFSRFSDQRSIFRCKT
jgi:hypothetical protein